MQSAIEEFAHKPGADGRSRGGDKEAEEEEEEGGGGGDEANIKSNNPQGISRSKVFFLKCTSVTVSSVLKGWEPHLSGGPSRR